MNIIGSVVRKITTRISYKKAYWIFSRLPSCFRDFYTTISFRGVKIKIFTGEVNGRAIYYFDNYEPRQIELFTSLIKPGMRFFDIGANIGIYTLLAAKQGASVFSFEPSPEILKILRENLKINSDISDKVLVVDEAVSDKKGVVDFYPHRKGNIGVGRIFKFGDNELDFKNPIKIRADSIDNYVTKYGNPGAIKIDIEGAEAFALYGGGGLFKKDDGPILMIEFHPGEVEQCGSTVEKLIEFLQGCGYKFRKVTPIKEQNPDWYIFYKNRIDEQALSKF